MDIPKYANICVDYEELMKKIVEKLPSKIKSIVTKSNNYLKIVINSKKRNPRRTNFIITHFIIKSQYYSVLYGFNPVIFLIFLLVHIFRRK